MINGFKMYHSDFSRALHGIENFPLTHSVTAVLVSSRWQCGLGLFITRVLTGQLKSEEEASSRVARLTLGGGHLETRGGVTWRCVGHF